MNSFPNTPTVRSCPNGLVLESADLPRLQSALGVLLRRAVIESSDIKDCAARCGVSVAELRRLSYLTGVPLLFAVTPRGEP